MTEDTKSHELYQSRLRDNTEQKRRQLKNVHRQLDGTTTVSDDESDPMVDPMIETSLDNNNNDSDQQQQLQYGMMIDAGSQGTRMHVYQYYARILDTKEDVQKAVQGLKLSYPTTETRWTNRLKPGLDRFAYIENDQERLVQVQNYLEPLLNFSKYVLHNEKLDWSEYPIYLKATAGLRTLPRPYRIRLMNVVRTIMHNTTFNPFYFQDEHARVISGEEEGIYAWASVNFVKGQLIQDSQGMGSVGAGVVDHSTTNVSSKSYGVLEMGGASAQIGFFEPDGDIMANLFKLQIGAAKHWNVYVHSFLYFGIERAYDRLNAALYTTALENGQYQNKTQKGIVDSIPTGIYNPCLPGGETYLFSSRVRALPDGSFLPLSSPNDANVIEADLYSAILSNTRPTGDYDVCKQQVHKLLRKEANRWCDFAHDRDCSFAGIYQPPIPINDNKYFGEFIATANFYEVFDFLGLSDDGSGTKKATIKQLQQNAKAICNLHSNELKVYNNLRKVPLEMLDLNQMCFRSVFVEEFLVSGVGFPTSYSITAIDIINGQQLGWQLGAMLYEINTLPWVFKNTYTQHHQKLLGDTYLTGKVMRWSVGNQDFVVGNVLGFLVMVTAMFGIFGVLFTVKRKSSNSSQDVRLGERTLLLE